MTTLALSTQDIAIQLRGPLRAALARNGVSAADVDDLSQDVLLVLHRRAATFPNERAACSWLRAAARRVASNARRSARRASFRRSSSWEQSCWPSPEEWLEQRDARALFEVFLDELPHEQRRVFELSELEGWSATDISRRTGENLNTVYAWIRRLRQRWAARTAMLVLLAVVLLLGMLASNCGLQPSDSVTRSAVATSSEAKDDRRHSILVAARLAS